MEGDTKEKCNEENDNNSSPLRITSQAKANNESNDNQINNFKTDNKEGYTKHDDEEGCTTDNPKATEDRIQRNKVEMTSTQLLKNKDKLLDAKDKLLEDKNKLLKNQNKLLKSHNKVLETKDKLIESQDKVVEKQTQLLKDMEKLLEKNSTGGGGVEKAVVRKNTLKRRKAEPKPIASRGDESKVEKIELLEKKINILEAILKTVVDNVTGGELEITENETLPDALERLSAHAIFTGRT